LDFADKYRMPAIALDDKALIMLQKYAWPGNIRQLKNITEQISIIEKVRIINQETLGKYLPDFHEARLPALYRSNDTKSFGSEREILYQVLFDMKNDMNDMKKLVLEMIKKGTATEEFIQNNAQIIQKLYTGNDIFTPAHTPSKTIEINPNDNIHIEDTEEIVEESLSISDKEIELIRKALEKHNGKRKNAAHELGISERTLYRKIKEYDIDN
jgi:transcriptional regulator with PAS, ATPase and Fis domain